MSTVLLIFMTVKQTLIFSPLFGQLYRKITIFLYISRCSGLWLIIFPRGGGGGLELGIQPTCKYAWP